MQATRKDLLHNELMKEILRIRIDTLWNMLALQRQGRLPPVDAEKATGDLDDKGGLFLPGGLVLHDYEGRPITPEPVRDRNPAAFRAAVRQAMSHDGAHLIYPGGIARAKLGNSAFSRMASSILHNRREALRRDSRIGDRVPERIGSQEICKSHCPTWVPPPYGSRTSLGSDLAVCLTEPRMYFLQCLEYFDLRADEAAALWEGLKAARQPLGTAELTLAPPLVVTCHNTRYRDSNLVGLTRLCGYGMFGEFATLTMEPVNADLLHEMESPRDHLAPDEITAEFDGQQIAIVLRLYPRTTPGARLLKGVVTMPVSPVRDLDLDLERITAEARARYGV
ncbi:MAG: hypothetical protein AB7O97_05975 [Planctomycetota bacterium]